MKKTSLLNSILIVLAALTATSKSLANIATDQPLPLSHCYHWLQQSKGYLDFKYDYASKNENELTFFTSPATSNGSVAGPGLYCAKSPSGSFNYGDRVIRIEFVRDIVFLDAFTNRKICGIDGKLYQTDAECQSKDWDVKYYSRNADWYVIQNPRAVMSWSATNNQLIRDLQAEVSYGPSGFSGHVNNTINLIRQDISKNGDRSFLNARARMGFAQIVKSKDLMRSLPAMAILAEIGGEGAKLVSAERLKWATDTTITRIYQDSSLPWADVKAAIEKNKNLKKSFAEGLKAQVDQMNAGKGASRNLAVMVMIASMEGSGFPADQMPNLISGLFKNPKNFISARFAKDELSSDAKRLLEDAVVQKLNAPETKADINTIVALMSFTNGNTLDSRVQADVENFFYDHIKAMGASKYFLVDDDKKYPLADTAAKAMQLCQAHISAYQLFNKNLKISNGSVHVEIGQAPDFQSAITLCQNQKDMIIAMSKVKNAKGKAFYITGKIDNIPYKFVTTDQETLIPQYNAFLKANSIANPASISYSVNGSQEATFSRAYYWDNAAMEIALKNQLEPQGIRPKADVKIITQIEKLSEDKKYTVDARFVQANNFKVHFGVDTLEDFDKQCVLIAPKLAGTSRNYLYFSVNGSSEESIYGDSDVNTNCGNLRKMIYERGIVGKEEAKTLSKIADLAQGKKFQIKATIGKFQIAFGADVLEDFEKQCAMLGTKFDGGTIHYPELSINGAPNERSSKTHLNTTVAVCAAYKEELYARGVVGKQEAINFNKIANLAQGKKYQILAKINGFPVTFGANVLEDFDQQCALLGTKWDGINVNYPTFQINGAAEERTSKYYLTKTADICASYREVFYAKGIVSQAETNVLAAIAKKSVGKTYKVDIKIDQFPISLGGDSLEDLRQQCTDLKPVMTYRQPTYIYYSVNGAPETYFSLSYSDKNHEGLCKNLLPIIANGGVKSKFAQQMAQNRSKYTYSFDINADNKQLTLAVNSYDKIVDQCTTLFTTSEIARTGNIAIKFPGQADRTVRTGNYMSTQESCEGIRNAVFGLIPSPEQVAISKLTSRWEVKMTVYNVPMTFKVNNSDQLFGQCLNLFDEAPRMHLGYVKYELNGTAAMNLPGTWNKPADLCRALATSLKKMK